MTSKDTKLDLIISPSEQNKWLENDGISNEVDKPSSFDDIEYQTKCGQRLEKLKQVAIYPSLKPILDSYIKNCLPAFKSTERTFWSLSCMPSTNKSRAPRFFCLSVNFMEVFVAGYVRETKEPFYIINMTDTFTGNEFDKICTKYKTLEVHTRGYKAAGDDQVNFHFSDLNELKDFLSESKIIKSIKELNLRLMQKGPTIYARYHCFAFANDVLSNANQA